MSIHTYSEVLPAAEALPRAERLRLMQALLRSLAQEEGVALLDPNTTYEVWSPFDAYEGAAKLYQFLQDGPGERP